MELKFENTRKLRTECGRLAVQKKRAIGEIPLKGKDDKYLYTIEDREWMKTIVKEAHEKITEPNHSSDPLLTFEYKRENPSLRTHDTKNSCSA